MSATNTTPNIELPVFVGTDKPAWLTDWNGAMNKIDAAVGSAETDISGLESSVATQGQSINSLSNTVGQHTTSIQALTTETTHNAGDINTINALIGNGEPTTTDKTIIGAINELYDDIHEPGGVEAENVAYDNTTSGLAATDVQAAIDEVNDKIVDFSINFTRSANLTVTATQGVSPVGSAKLLTNAENSIGKIYGGFRFTTALAIASNQELILCTLSGTGLPAISEDYDISVGLLQVFDGNGSWEYSVSGIIRFKENGSVDLVVKGSPDAITAANHYIFFNLPPCIYVFSDLGD